MQEIRDLLLQTAQQQNQTSNNIDRLEKLQEQTNQLLQNFIREWSRVHANDAEKIAKSDAATDVNHEAIKRLSNTLENTNLRLNDVIDYLRRDGT